jgi:CBS domain-containing protein
MICHESIRRDANNGRDCEAQYASGRCRTIAAGDQPARVASHRSRWKVGIISEGDFLYRAELDVEPPQSWLDGLLHKTRVRVSRNHSLFVGRIMTQAPVCVSPDAPLDDVVALMDIHRIAQILVPDDGSVVGLVSRLELVAAVERQLSRTEHITTTAPAPAYQEKS